MGGYVLDLQEIDRTQVAVVGVKAAVLGELSQIEGIGVPAGFCVTTEVFRRITAAASIEDRLDQLSRLRPDDREAIRALSGDVRQALGPVPIPQEVIAAIRGSLASGSNSPSPSGPARRWRTCPRPRSRVCTTPT
jgi:phosphoenolpyruvate synthase/pyruvate phosphate dikinase